MHKKSLNERFAHLVDKMQDKGFQDGFAAGIQKAIEVTGHTEPPPEELSDTFIAGWRAATRRVREKLRSEYCNRT